MCCKFTTHFLFMATIDKRKHNNAAHLIKEPIAKKQPITIYEAGIDINKLGGIKEVRRILKVAFDAALNGCANF
jgi:hypothetical protein